MARKRILTILVALILIGWPLQSFAATPGDNDNDGTVGLSDALNALKIVSKITVGLPQTITENPDMDINDDDAIGIEEAIYALQATAGLRDSEDPKQMPESAMLFGVGLLGMFGYGIRKRTGSATTRHRS